MDIVFNVNPLGLEGLGATLTSLIRNCSNSQELKLWFLCSEFRIKDKFNINQLLESVGFKGTVEYIDFDAKEIFGHLRSLHGDWTAYGRLLIANYVKTDKALYLDSDLVILLDVLTLKDFNFEGAIIAAVYGCTVSLALDGVFFMNNLHWSPDKSYFNSGVVYFNLLKWREENIEAKWKSLAEKYPKDLISHDQTLLNAVCEGDFAHLSSNYNNPWYPGRGRPEDADRSIIHFVGSPKPWDIFGKIIHKGYKTWATYNTRAWKEEYCTITTDKIGRTWKIKKSILKHLKNKLFG